MRFQSVQNDITHQEEEIAIQTGRIDVSYDKINAEVIDRREADNVLTGRITIEAKKITQIVESVGADGKVTAASIVTAVNNGSSSIVLSADHIDIDGLVRKLRAEQIAVDSIHTLSGSNLFEGQCSFPDHVYCVDLEVQQDGFTYAGHVAKWRSTTIRRITAMSEVHNFIYGTNASTPQGIARGQIIAASSDQTIYYLGY